MKFLVYFLCENICLWFVIVLSWYLFYVEFLLILGDFVVVLNVGIILNYLFRFFLIVFFNNWFLE